ncbi:MAG: alkaline phosphatase family protein [Chloroflexi bacterium]|nr:alkaline phosphatase family protein [Chloroflexota bacterium]MCL5075085.1 alkaline phosphatase family protein [Chloroflexota bacterium]
MKKKAIVIGLDSISLPWVKRFAAEGALPNMKRLMEMGATNKAMPCIPAYTPTNWATIATGAWPGTHGAGNWNDRSPADPAARVSLSTFDSRAIMAETIWGVAEQAGLRSLVIAYPGSWPPRITNGYVVAPLDKGLVSRQMIPGAEYTTAAAGPKAINVTLTQTKNEHFASNKRPLETTIIVSPQHPALTGKTERGVPWGFDLAQQVGAVEDGADLETAVIEGRIHASTAAVSASEAVFHALVLNSQGQGYDRLLLYEGNDSSHPAADLKVGDWSPWFFKRFELNGRREGGSFRFKLLHLSPDGRELRLLRSEVYPTAGFTHPSGLAEELIAKVGPYFEHPVLKEPRTREEEDAVIEEVRYQAMWHARVAEYLNGHWDLYYSHWHWTDSAEHRWLAASDPASPAYDPAEAQRCLDFRRRSYQGADEMVGAFLKMADEQTYIAVISDHGNSPNIRVCSTLKLLAESGLTVFRGDPYRPLGIDWTRSRAYPHGALQICVNLKGREPQGIVSAEDYEKVQEEIIDLLYNWREPQTGKRAIALALKKKDAPLIGFWGERAGDVIFVFNQGFGWGRPTAGTIDVAPLSANHGPQVPTAETSLSSNLAVLIMAGPGIKRGYERDYQRYGLMRLVDFVPTLSFLLGFKPPAQSAGTVLYDLLEE